jgi:hypothetical protein
VHDLPSQAYSAIANVSRRCTSHGSHAPIEERDMMTERAVPGLEPMMIRVLFSPLKLSYDPVVSLSEL